MLGKIDGSGSDNHTGVETVTVYNSDTGASVAGQVAISDPADTTWGVGNSFKTSSAATEQAAGVWVEAGTAAGNPQKAKLKVKGIVTGVYGDGSVAAGDLVVASGTAGTATKYVATTHTGVLPFAEALTADSGSPATFTARLLDPLGLAG